MDGNRDLHLETPMSGPSVLRLILVSLLLSIPTSPIQGQEGPMVHAPSGSPIILDGRLSVDEWANALQEPLSGGGELLLMAHGQNLFLGVRGPGFGLAHVAMASPDTIWVLHASAALGSIVYARGPEGWDKVRDPVWELRDTTLSPEASQARLAYLKENGWVATTGKMGRENEVEFLIRKDRFGSHDIRLAVVFFPVGPPGALPR